MRATAPHRARRGRWHAFHGAENSGLLGRESLIALGILNEDSGTSPAGVEQGIEAEGPNDQVPAEALARLPSEAALTPRLPLRVTLG